MESPYTLKEVYKLRAQQLRDSYDYLILSFSGGSDSWTVLNAFLTNNIRLDEIFVRWPRSATEKIYRPDPNNLDSSNILSEWDFTIVPQLQFIANFHPEIKITVLDISDHILKVEYSDNILHLANDSLNIGFWGKYGSMAESEKRQIDKNKKVALILGVDKPQICVKNNGVYCYFLDHLVNGNLNYSFVNTGRTVEFFYWSPSMPEVTHTQAREIYNQLRTQKNLAKLMQWGRPFTRGEKTIWDRWVRSIIYPEYDSSQFQATKGTSSFYTETDDWTNHYTDSHAKKSWTSMMNNVISTIDPKYFRYDDKFGATAFVGFVSNFYYLGNLDVTKID